MLLNAAMAANHVTESEFSKRTQAGIDLSVNKIESINGGGNVLKNKTEIEAANYKEYPLSEMTGPAYINGVKGWYLYKGAYSVTFNEGIKVPSNAQAKITHRSSIYRMGNIIESPWWDAGFQCDNMNTTLIVNTPMFVEQNARLAQVVFWEMYEADTMYNGQWQSLSSAAHKTKPD